MLNDDVKISGTPRRLARFAAVQTLYQMDHNDHNNHDHADKSTLELISNTVNGMQSNADNNLYKDLVNPFKQNIAVHDEMIVPFLSSTWPINRLAAINKAILRSAYNELSTALTTPVPVIINEYLEVAKHFVDHQDLSFINGALDAMAKKIRPS